MKRLVIAIEWNDAITDTLPLVHKTVTRCGDWKEVLKEVAGV